ncbi:CRISPR-associated helicase/endonuclease Cas3 [Methylosinus sp. PW1]|uniref:CRISPR-associated helicase/endonuclease Cas3 n=1 Tax=Methylosinus sp. PW1 TaxID=107636 RepID=UPI000562D00A|nr:CRISPR-associated helicase/endonuclease Cas3 [Methylosinus sp. PW1]
MPIYAHSTDRPDESTWEPLEKHLKQVEDLAEARAGKFGAADYGAKAGWLHDFGKVDPRFQARLRGAKAPFDHAGPGAALARELFGVFAGLLAPIIAGHHTGLMDGTRDGEASVDITPLDERLGYCVGDLEQQKSLWSAEGLTFPAPPSAPPVKPRKESGRDDGSVSAAFCLSFFTRMVFSALVDADFLATEAFYAKYERRNISRGLGEFALADLKRRLDDFLAAKCERARREHPGPLNDARAAILASARASAHTGQGIFTLAVPTGGGKTLASLAFALDHAIAKELDRVIVVIPFTSVVEQTAEVYREAFGDLKGAVLEHHGAFDDTKIRREGDAPEMRDKLKLAQENWDAPIVVTTAAQFFESLFHNKNARCRKLHNIARSVVILDEAQTLPLPVLRPIVLAIDELARNYRTTIVLSTATQPALLERPAESEKSFVGGLRDVRPIIADETPLFQVLKRVEIESIGRQDDAALTERILRQGQALTIVNTRKHARELFALIRREDGARHLSTMMCAAHRSEALDAIRQDLANERPARVISTSLIEAGVDISFPLVLRAEAGLDQIAQAAGRCNREGRRAASESRVLVFEAADGNGHPEMQKRWSATKEVWRRLERGELEGSLLDPPAIEAYFQALFWLKGDAALDEYEILKLLRAYAPKRGQPLQLPMESIARRFKMIDDAMAPLLIGWDETARKEIDALRHAEWVGGVARRLQRYLVNVPPRDRARLIQRRAAEVIQPERFGEQFVVLSDMGLYRADVGLDVSDPAFEEARRLIV